MAPCTPTLPPRPQQTAAVLLQPATTQLPHKCAYNANCEYPAPHLSRKTREEIRWKQIQPHTQQAVLHSFSAQPASSSFLSSSRATLPCNYRGKLKGRLSPANQVDFCLFSHKQVSKSIYRFPSWSPGVNKLMHTLAWLLLQPLPPPCTH